VLALVVGYLDVLVLGTLVAGVGLLFQVTADVLSIPLQSQLRLGRLTVVDLGRRIIALLLIGLLAVLGASLLPLIAASTIAGAAALVLLAWIVRSSITIRLSFDWKAWRALFAETLPYAIAVSIGAIYFYVTVIVMSLIASANQTGLFATSFRVIQVALGIPILLLTAIFPLMSDERLDRDSATGDMFGKVFSVAVIGGVWMSLAMALGAPFIIDVIAGNPGRGAVSVLRIQGLVFIPSFISSSCGLILISLRQYRRIMIVSSAALAVNIVLALALVPVLGAKGGALGDVLTEALVATALTALLLRAVPHHPIKASVAPPVLLAAAVSALVLLLPFGSAARVITATVIYFGVLMLTRTIPTEVTDAARRLREVRS
jgi:O-antigen/teichoic acid export membrane protein